MVFISVLLNIFFGDVVGCETCRRWFYPGRRLTSMRRREVVDVVGKDLWIYKHTLPKTNMDTPNYVFEKVTPFEYGLFWYIIYLC